MRKLSAWLLIIVIFYSAWAVTPVLAHALLLRSNPAANAVLARAPVQVELYFSESLEPQLSSVKVLDTNGQTVDAVDSRVDPSDPTRMTVSLRSLIDGIYTVTWKAISATDGHQTTGTFSFAVGNINPSTMPINQSTTSSNLPASALIAKWLMLASLALLAGQLPFTTLVWSPVIRSNEERSLSIPEPGVWKNLYLIGFVGVLLAFGIGVLSQAGQSTGNELALPWAKETNSVLVGTRLGVIWLTRLALAIIGIWLAKQRDTKWKPWAGFFISLSLLFSISLTSHAATETHPTLPILDDWIHLIGMTVWFGGLVYLLSGLHELQTTEDKLRTRLTSLLMIRFSWMALVSVGLIGITGLYSAILRVGSMSALLTSIYGHALLLKQVFVAALLILAGFNLLIMTPRLNRARLLGRSNIILVRRFSKVVLVEIITACLLLVSVSLLTYLPPAKIIIPNTDLTGMQNVDDLMMDISITPGYVGQNIFTLHLESNGENVQSAKEVLLRFTPSQGNIPPSELQLIARGNGTFAAKGTSLSLPANWQVQAIVRREGKFDAYANFNFNVQKAGSAGESSVIPRIAGSLFIIIGLLFTLVMFSLLEQPSLRLGIGGLLGVFMVALGIFQLTRPITSTNGQANPIVPNSASIKAGQTLYTTYCVPCHGIAGKGDGPVGLTLNPHPADLSLHAVPGVHTDAQLFEWITNGFPGSSMPAWKSVISDTDRWNLVNFIRTLAPTPQ